MIHLVGIKIHRVNDKWSHLEQVLAINKIDGLHSRKYLVHLLKEVLQDLGCGQR